jgi:hypothetical protein
LNATSISSNGSIVFIINMVLFPATFLFKNNKTIKNKIH